MIDTTNYKIYEELDTLTGNYYNINSSLEKIEGLTRSQFRVIKMVEYYTDSKYLGTYLGNVKQVDNSSMDIPFYNIVNYRVTLARTATDMNISDIQIKSDNPKQQVHAMLLNHEAYEWMKESDFSLTLNEMGLTRPKYGGYLVKKVETGDKMKIEVVRWTNVVTDQNDILGGTIIEEHQMSPTALKKKDKVWDNVDEVLRAYKGMRTNRPNTIKVSEMTGEMPISVFKNANDEEETDEDNYNYSLQRYFIADVNGKKILLDSKELSGEMTDYYQYLSWEENGYGLGRGVVEDGEEAQVWTNDAVINEFIAMTLAGRVGLKTTSKKLGNNVLAHDHGKIYEMETGADINSFNLAPSSLPHYQNQVTKWNAQFDNTASSHGALTGEAPLSGTPYSQTVLLNQVASKPYDQRRQEWGIHITKLFDKWVIPQLIKRIKKEHILVSDFTEEELENIDESFAFKHSNSELIKRVLAGGTPDALEQEGLIDGYKAHIKKSGKVRFIEVPEDYFKDIETKVTVITTGEQKNKAVTLTSLSNLMETVIKSFNPATGKFGVLEDPTLSKIFNEIMELANAGVSPMSVGKGNKPQATPTTSSQTPQSTPAVPTGTAAPQPSTPLTTS